jgi:uncharacterized RDD family membrane protein YckC
MTDTAVCPYMPDTDLATAGLLRRLAALLYDSLLVVALLMLATVPYVMLTGGAAASHLARALFQTYLLAVMLGFFSWFWLHGGQTLGMRAWRLRVVSQNGAPLRPRQALARFAWALPSLLLFGLGLLWVLVDQERLAWHDRLSGTRLVVLPKVKTKKPKKA